MDMNDKQKQIEEMAKVIFAYVDSKDRDKVYILHSKVVEDMKTYSHNYGVAEKLYNANCRIVDKGWVVLTKGAYESLSNKAKANVVKAVEIHKQAVKEVLDKIYDYGQYFFVKCNFMEGNNFNGMLGDKFNVMLKEIAKDFGVEVEE